MLSHPAGLRFTNLANATSTTFAGWVLTPKGATSVTTEYKVPALTCTSTTSGVAPGAFMATGTSKAPNSNAAGVILECASGTPAAAPGVIVDGVESAAPNAVAVGDLMKATITTSAAKTTATIADLTTGHTFTFSKSGKGAASLENCALAGSVTSSTGA